MRFSYKRTSRLSKRVCVRLFARCVSVSQRRVLQPIEQLERQECTIDRLHQIECFNVDASEAFEQAPGYYSHVYLDPHDNLVTEEQEVQGLYSVRLCFFFVVQSCFFLKVLL